MKFLKLLLKIILGLILFILLTFLILKIAFDKDLPSGNKGPEAEALAQNMLAAINYSAWDTLSYAKWTFREAHHFVWDRKNNNALIRWDNNEVHLDMDKIDGKAYKNGQLLTGDTKNKLIQKAWSFWCNDSFWFNAPAKIFDPGTERSVVENEHGTKSLLVTYASGGVTPGDSYLWNLNESGLPESWRMWTKIIPIGGVYTSWEDWVTLPGGAKISSMHKNGKLKIPITNISGGESWSDVGFESNPMDL
jgi:hypothetical protein